jgi:hypothetical protein
MKLFACMCNQPQRLSAALAPVRSVLVSQPPVARWGLAYHHAGDLLLVRTPRPSERPVDLAGALIGAPPTPAEIATDSAIGLAVVADASLENPVGGTDNTPPFRFRRWMFGQTGRVAIEDLAPALVDHIPEYLRRNIRGRTSAELIFHAFLAMLADEGNMDDANLPIAVARTALTNTLRLVRSELEKAHEPTSLGNLAVSNGRIMIVAHLSEPLRMRRLWVMDDRGGKDPQFRGVIMLSGGDGDPKDGFEDVPANSAVLVERDLKVSFAEV